MTGLSISGRRAGLIRRWHSGIGLLAAALQFGSAVLSPLAIDDPGTVGLLGLVGWLIWVVWVVAYGITLIRPGIRSPSRRYRITDAPVPLSHFDQTIRRPIYPMTWFRHCRVPALRAIVNCRSQEVVDQLHAMNRVSCCPCLTSRRRSRAARPRSLSSWPA
jgi:hypothetical protein